MHVLWQILKRAILVQKKVFILNLVEFLRNFSKKIIFQHTKMVLKIINIINKVLKNHVLDLKKTNQKYL